MNIAEIRKTMTDKGIPADITERFVYQDSETETPEDKLAFAEQMDRLLTREQILSVMEEQGCEKNPPAAELMAELAGKSVGERIDALNAKGMDEQARSRLNGDGTLSIYWHFGEDGKYACVCPIINRLPKPVSASLTFCGCCSGHVKYHFQNSLGVKLRLLETVSSPISSGGIEYCEHLFEITI